MAHFMAQRTLQDFLQETEDAISSGRLDSALAHCQTILASFPESLEAQRLLGEVYLAQGRLEEALHAFDWVLTNDPENVIAYCNRAMVSERMSDIDTALDCYQQAYELSRGNGQIRQEFTQLSAKLGQQGFIFSRAGLARLYMRGDLLMQAIQEWGVVLAAAPERLDARTGLLEAYWREGSLDRIEELATQILQNVPGCLKALLLLAHVVAPNDMARAQTLLRQVEALDPDLVMAQDLFADLLARYPEDPFLKLLKKASSIVKAPPVLEASSQAASSILAVNAQNAAPLSGGKQPISGMGSSGVSSQWENAQSWSNDAAFLAPFSNGEVQQKNDLPWALDGATNTMAHSDVSKSDQRQESSSGFEPSDLAVQLSSDITPSGSWTLQPGSSSSEASQPEPWEMLQDALHNISGMSRGQEQGESQQWEDQGAVSDLDASEERWQDQSLDTLVEPDASSNDHWVSPVGSHGAKENDWLLATQEKSPPSWLSMLTQADRSQMTTESAPLEESASALVQPAEAAPSQQEPIAQQPVKSLSSSLRTEALASAPSLDGDDDESGFGPAWLKSLGATSFEEQEEAHLEQLAPSLSPVATEAGKQELPAAYTSQGSGSIGNDTASENVTASQGSSEKHHPQVSHYSSQNAFETELVEQPAMSDLWKTSEPESYSAAYEPWGTPTPELQKLSDEDEAWNVSALPEQVEVSELEAQPNAYVSWQETLAAALESERQPRAEVDLQEQLAAFELGKPFNATSQPEAIASSSTKAEQDLVATLEELEQKLQAKGFVAMEPNSLSAIAQAQEAKLANTVTPLSTQQESQFVQETIQEQSSPSALAELGMMFQQTADTTKPLISSASSAPNPVDFPVEPSWLQALRPNSVSDKEDTIAQFAGSSESAASLTCSPPAISEPVVPTNVAQALPNTPHVHMEDTHGLTFESASISVPPSVINQQPEALNGQAPRINPFLESELEMTMKRPAVRLQSIIHSVTSRDIASVAGKVHTSETGESLVARTAESDNLSYKERLLKGYQHQLVGDYDEAMQDYRFVIRGAPELLGEIISNLRALLKLAPKYSAGYRVLGDAYMRQGEYLQAMESYNNALTMAKKTR